MGGTSQEKSADSWGRDGELSLVIQLLCQIKIQDTEAYLGSAKQKNAERDLVGKGTRTQEWEKEKRVEGVICTERGI